MISEKIKSLIQSQDPHTGMDQLFFTNSEIFHASYDAIFKKQWVFLTHLSYFNENDIFTYNLNKGFIEIKKTDDNQLSISASDQNIKCHLKVYESLVFINLSNSPYSFDEFI